MTNTILDLLYNIENRRMGSSVDLVVYLLIESLIPPMVIHFRGSPEKYEVLKRTELKMRLDSKEIGVGTYGKIRKGVDERGLLAVKTFTFSEEPLHITTLREIKALRSIHSDFVLELEYIVVNKHKLFLAMPFFDSDLYRMIGTVVFDLEDIKDIFWQILKGTQAIHNAGYIHRDLKTANILINRRRDPDKEEAKRLKKNCRRYKACICDFGMARVMGKDMTPNVVTLWYRPPEILLGSTNYTKSCDIWSLGCILLELFNRKPIFNANMDVDVLYMIIDMCGSIDETTFPGCTQLPCFNKYRLKSGNNRVYEMFEKFGKDAADLASRMLEIDPRMRISIEDALKHPFFY